MSSEQIPFTISTQGTVAPGGPHGVPPSDVNAAIVAEQDKSLTTKVGEKVEALKESAQPYVQPVVAAAQPYVQAASNTAVNVAVAGKEAVVSGATQLGIVSDNSGPHGIPPSDVNHQGVVANQDKSISTRVTEAAQPYVQPIVNAATGAVVATKEAVVSGAQAAGAAIGIGGAQNQQGTTPGGPHGVPPSEAGPGVVATEDKKYTTRVSEAAQPYIQPVVDAAQPYVSAAAGVVGSATQSAANTITNVTHTVTGTDKPSGPPEGPHGLAPSESGPGVVAQEDKSLTTRVIEAAQPVIQPVVNAAQGAAAVVGQVAAQTRDVLSTQSSQIGEQIAELRDEAQRQAGFGVSTSGGKPEAPHGVAPTNFHPAIVSNQDKTYVQIAGEKLADAKDQAAATLSTVVGEAKHQVGLGVNVQPGTVPEGPHGVAPSLGNHQGLVSNQDKTYVQIAGEKVAEVKDQAAASLSNVVGEAKHQAGLGVHVAPGTKPEAPHGVAPSAANHQGLVSTQDKTYVQIAGDKVADAKDQAAAALTDASSNVQGVVGEVKHQAGLGVHVAPGTKPEAPHGVAPSNALPTGLVSEQDKVLSQKANEKIEQVRDQAVNTVNAASTQVQAAASTAKDQASAVVSVAKDQAQVAVNQVAGAVNNSVGEAKFQAGQGVNVQAGVTPVAPHGVAPSEGLHQGLVAQQDKTVAQVAGEKIGL